MRLILASGSEFRAKLLRNAGVDFDVIAADIDERSVKENMARASSSAADVAMALAEAKALKVASRNPGAIVIGADQMLDCDGIWYDKPRDIAGARKSLEQLRGRRHELLSAVCIAEDGRISWRYLETARLTMRPFSDRFLDDYLLQVGDRAALSVGAYQLEGLGGQLFERIEGDYFCILGLPLLPLLEELRRIGVLTP